MRAGWPSLAPDVPQPIRERTGNECAIMFTQEMPENMLHDTSTDLTLPLLLHHT